MTKFAPVAVALALLVALAPAAATDPKPDAKDKAAQEKAVKELVDKAVTAFGKRDIDALVEMSDLPWYCVGSISDNVMRLKKDLFITFEDKPQFDPKHTIQKVATFKDAKRDLKESRVKAFEKVLTDSDLVVEVEFTYLGKELDMSVLLKLRDGKPRLVGFGL